MQFLLHLLASRAIKAVIMASPFPVSYQLSNGCPIEIYDCSEKPDKLRIRKCWAKCYDKRRKMPFVLCIALPKTNLFVSVNRVADKQGDLISFFVCIFVRIMRRQFGTLSS